MAYRFQWPLIIKLRWPLYKVVDPRVILYDINGLPYAPPAYFGPTGSQHGDDMSYHGPVGGSGEAGSLLPQKRPRMEVQLCESYGGPGHSRINSGGGGGSIKPDAKPLLP